MNNERPTVAQLREHLYAEVRRVKVELDKSVAEYQELHGAPLEGAYDEFLAALDGIRDDEIRTAVLEINLRHEQLKRELFPENIPAHTKPHELN